MNVMYILGDLRCTCRIRSQWQARFLGVAQSSLAAKRPSAPRGDRELGFSMPQTRGKFASQFGPSELHIGSILSLAPSITVKAQAGVISLRAGWSMEGSVRGVDSQRKMARLFSPPVSDIRTHTAGGIPPCADGGLTQWQRRKRSGLLQQG